MIWSDMSIAPVDRPIEGRNADGQVAVIRQSVIHEKIGLVGWTVGEPDASNPNWTKYEMFYPIEWREVDLLS